MTVCEYRSRLDAYHDGELAPPSARELESHLESCPACAAELAELRNLSGLFAFFSEESMSRAAVSRAHDAVERDAQPSLLRIAGLLAGLAASAMVIGTAWLWETPTPALIHPGFVSREPSGAKAAEWEMIAMTLRAEPVPGEAGGGPSEMISEPAVADAADWMLKSLGNGPWQNQR